jgi:hypothetical protein
MSTEDIPNETLIDHIARLLVAAVQVASDDEPPLDLEPVCLFCQLPPDITVDAYLRRIVRYMFMSEWTMVLMVHYIVSIIENTPELTLNAWTVHRLMATAGMIAFKFHAEDHDAPVTHMERMARVIGFKTEEAVKMERLGLQALDYRLVVSKSTCDALRAEICREAARLADEAGQYDLPGPCEEDDN